MRSSESFGDLTCFEDGEILVECFRSLVIPEITRLHPKNQDDLEAIIGQVISIPELPDEVYTAILITRHRKGARLDLYHLDPWFVGMLSLKRLWGEEPLSHSGATFKIDPHASALVGNNSSFMDNVDNVVTEESIERSIIENFRGITLTKTPATYSADGSPIYPDSRFKGIVYPILKKRIIEIGK